MKSSSTAWVNEVCLEKSLSPHASTTSVKVSPISTPRRGREMDIPGDPRKNQPGLPARAERFHLAQNFRPKPRRWLSITLFASSRNVSGWPHPLKASDDPFPCFRCQRQHHSNARDRIAIMCMEEGVVTVIRRWSWCAISHRCAPSHIAVIASLNRSSSMPSGCIIRFPLSSGMSRIFFLSAVSRFLLRNGTSLVIEVWDRLRQKLPSVAPQSLRPLASGRSVFLSIDGKRIDLWRAVDSEGEVLEVIRSTWPTASRRCPG